MKSDHIIVGIHVTERLKDAAQVQKIFAEYARNIKTRLGLHDVQGDHCGGGGIVVLEMLGETALIDGMLEKFWEIEGIEAKKMTFGHL